MVDTPILPNGGMGEEKVQTTKPLSGRSENCSGMHNLKVVSSNLTPATKTKYPTGVILILRGVDENSAK